MSEDAFGSLASLVNTAMSAHTKQALSGTGAVLGTITAGGLKLDDFKHEIPEYLVAELPGTLKLPDFAISGSVEGLRDSTGGGIDGQGKFQFAKTDIEKTLLDVKKGFQPGDRVLAFRLNGGQDVVVLCKVVNGHA
nr:hypothetical protein [Paenibacillus tuaregi]